MSSMGPLAVARALSRSVGDRDLVGWATDEQLSGVLRDERCRPHGSERNASRGNDVGFWIEGDGGGDANHGNIHFVAGDESAIVRTAVQRPGRGSEFDQ